MLVDAETGERRKSGRFVPDRGSMEAHVFDSLRARYRRVTVVPFGPDIIATMAQLKTLRPRIVFNLTEWVDSDRKLDHAIAGLLEMMKFRYTGTGAVGMQLAATRRYQTDRRSGRVDVPYGFTLERGDRIDNTALPFR